MADLDIIDYIDWVKFYNITFSLLKQTFTELKLIMSVAHMSSVYNMTDLNLQHASIKEGVFNFVHKGPVWLQAFIPGK